MEHFINLGYGNFVSASRIVTVASPDAAPVRRLIADAKEAGVAVDITAGKKTRAVLVMDTGHVILCALQTETVAERLMSGDRSGETIDTQQTEELS